MRARRWAPCRKRSVANRASASGRRGSPRPHSASPDVANVVFGIAQALRCASGIVGVPTRTAAAYAPECSREEYPVREERASRVAYREESSECERSPCARRALSNERIFACCVNEWPLSASWFDKSVCNARSSSQDTTQAKRPARGKTAGALPGVLPCPRPAEQPRFVSRKNGQWR